MAQFLFTEFLGLPTLCSIISDISQPIFEILVPIWLQISSIFGNTPNVLDWNGFEGSYRQKNTKFRNQKMCHFQPTQIFNLFWKWDFSIFFILIWLESTKMKFRPYFTMERVQKLMKNISIISKDLHVWIWIYCEIKYSNINMKIFLKLKQP